MIGSFKFPKNEGPHSFDIQFENLNGVVYAGQEIKGKVMVSLNGLMTIRGVRIRIFGKTRTSWADERLYQAPVQERVLEHVMCQGEQMIFDNTLVLYGHPPYEKDATRSSNRRREALKEGLYEFPFQFEIPAKCPTTFEGEHGYVRYLCCAILAIPFKHDRTVKRAFTVIKSCDLNSISLSQSDPLDQPIEDESSALSNVGCCILGKKRGNLTMSVYLATSGFVCGENVPIWVNVVNNSGQKLKKIKATLLQRVRYKGKNRNSANHDRIIYRTVAEVSTKEELASGWALIWDQERIHIPPVPPTTIDHIFDLIQIDYGLVYEAASVKVTIPIYVGTIPLKSSSKLLREHYEMDFKNRFPPEFLPLPPECKIYDYMPPPLYCKDDHTGPVSIRERADSEFVPGQLAYEPRYPYYAWPSSDFSISEETETDNISDIQ